MKTNAPKNFVPKFQIGQRVMPDNFSIQKARDYWLSCGREPMKSGAKKALDKIIAQRGTVVESGWNGYCAAVKVQWDDGMISKMMEHKAQLAE